MSEVDLQNVRAAYVCTYCMYLRVYPLPPLLPQVERFLLTVIDESYFLTVSMQYCVVLLEICEVGSWVIKYSKKMGLIVNNRSDPPVRTCVHMC